MPCLLIILPLLPPISIAVIRGDEDNATSNTTSRGCNPSLSLNDNHALKQNERKIFY